ncbi:protein kinase domain-containing protein [Gilvimarinus algae]|uniref:Protein kinase n=1 Tax=Gilvimarinus algae TaxID=3058037 RepID=A0ABT8TIY8_9GAMM|nr:protein kinase [Gilvimarinus sp. SDUM040014]MDO3384063.1 protein kinase [Gilvimarinus sp. SDUM040014]
MEIPGYKIIDTLGEGGMATVYLAIQESFEREVALKVMSQQLSKDPSFGERFIREARIVSRLMHPNIVTVYDVGVHNGNHYLSMEYIPGEDLKDHRYTLALDQSLQVVRDVAKALDYAGRKGYIHRDVKPENIMIHAEDGRAVLMDFGIARASDVASGMTQTGTTMGTPHYMSPEQAKGAKVDPRSDIYSLGVVLFQLICGYVPFDADSAVAVGIMHVSDPVPQLPEHLAVFQPIINRALAKKRDERYQNGGELIADLDAIPASKIDEIKAAIAALPKVDEVDESAATVVSAQVANTRVDTEEVARATRSAKVDDDQLGGADSFRVSSEDSIGYAASERTPKSGTGKAWLLGLVVLLAGGGWYAWQWLESEAPAERLPERELTQAPAIRSASSASMSSASSASVMATEQEAAAVAGQQAAASDIMTQAEALRMDYAEDASIAPELAALYRKMQGNAELGEQQAGELGLQELADSLDERIEKALAQGQVDEAKRLAAIRAETYADAGRDEALAATIAEREAQLWLDEALTRAAEYLAADALSSPAGANALDTYEQVLERYPGNTDAQAGLAQVVQRYEALAQAQLDNGDYTRAASLVERGLGVDPDNQTLKAMQTRLAQHTAELERQRQAREALVAKADAQLAADKLIAPKGDNAYETYSGLAEREPGSDVAAQGLAKVEQSLLGRIDSMIRAGALDEASLQLASARDRFPQSQALLTRRLQLDQLAEAQRPSVSRLEVSASPMETLGQPQPDELAPDRIIYLGFEYRNFDSEASVIQALLMDGSRSVQIAQVPVIVTSREGTKFFRIERPVAGFGKGGYHVDLQLGDQRLASVSFKVGE